MKIKCIAHNNGFELEFHFLEKKSHLTNAEVKNIQMSQYLLYEHNGLYRNGIAIEIDPVAYDIKVKFMLPHYPS